MHGKGTEITRKAAGFGPFGVVRFLHPILEEGRTRSGFGLAEAIVAVTVFGVGVLGVAALGGAARKMAHVAAVRSAQAVAAGGTLESGPSKVGGRLEVGVDTLGIFPGLIEIRVRVSGSGSAGALDWTVRRPVPGP